MHTSQNTRWPIALRAYGPDMFHRHKQSLLLLAVILLSRLFLLGIGVTASIHLGDYFLSSQAAPELPALDMWARWDSFWYLHIAQNGYFFATTQQSPVVFFPLYPLMMKTVSLLTGNALVAGVLVSQGCFLMALAVLYRLMLLETGDIDTARCGVVILCILPNTIFFAGVYTESLFLLVLLLTVYHLRRRHWAWAAFFGALTTATRLVGIAVLIFALLEWLACYRKQPRAGWKATLWIGLMPAGLLLYMAYLMAAFGDPLLFLTAQSGWEHHISNPITVLLDTLHGILNGAFYWWFAPGELLAAVLSLSLLPFVYRRYGLNYTLLAALLLLIPLLSTTRSFNRYALVVFPLVMLLASWRIHPTIQRLVLLISLLLMALTTILFVRGAFIA